MLNRLYRWYGKTVVRGFIAAVVVLIGLGLYFTLIAGNGAEITETENLKRVTVKTAGELSASGSELTTVGTVRAVSEARLQTESSGRITRVHYGIGDHVAAGAVLASIENSREQASLLQAEGGYDSARAAAAQSNVGLSASEENLTSAQISALNAYRSAFVTADDVMRNTLVELFTDYNRSVFDLDELTWERKLIEYDLEAWSTRTTGNTNPANAKDALPEAISVVEAGAAFVDKVYNKILENDSAGDSEHQTLISSYKQSLSTARADMNNALQALTNAQTNVQNAESALEQAKISGTGSLVSSANAQVKQALGTLRAAQAAYEKTLIRSPIAGTVNAMYVRENEYVSMSQPAAVVANNNALEITTAVNETDRETIAINDTVTIEDSFTGTVSRIAPAIDPVSGKIEVRINVDSTPEGTKRLENGNTVRVTFTRTSSTEAQGELRVPLAAFKITPEGPVAFTVTEDGTLASVRVVLGTILGDSVIVTEGISRDTRIVSDARGLKDGEKVDVN